MPLKDEWERCEPNDPNRCQGNDRTGQCRYKARPNNKYCPRHAATSDQLAAKRAADRYNLQLYQERFSHFTIDSEVKNLRAEIGVLRLLLENVFKSCNNDDSKLLAYSGKIGDLVIKIRALVLSCQSLEKQMGLMLDRDKVILIGQRIVEIVAEAVPNQAVLDDIGERIVGAIMQISQE